MKPRVTIIDYGMGNLLSVTRAFEHCGAEVQLTEDPRVMRTSPRLVLPGVGAFGDGMAELRRQGIDEIVKEMASKGTPILGICLGMQMLLDESEEYDLTSGLGLIPGRVVPVPALTSDGNLQKIPHIGWNELVLPQGRDGWEGTIMQKVALGESVYFVHSFMAVPNNPEHRIADCIYGGIRVAATIGRDNIHGCQFHPEKSGKVGLSILENFIRLA